jgi:hypothetical protein
LRHWKLPEQLFCRFLRCILIIELGFEIFVNNKRESICWDNVQRAEYFLAAAPGFEESVS